LLNNPELIENQIHDLKDKKLLFSQRIDEEEMQGHIVKAEHNLRFTAKIAKEGFEDWALIGCYYSCYHATLALIISKGYTSKNHLATICIIIKEFYNHELSKKDIELLSEFLDYEDVLLYVETKNKRETASYTTNTSFDKKDVEKLRIQAVLFVHKIKEILAQKGFM
jgi:uncharacterized protein (UPF0332 family)